MYTIIIAGSNVYSHFSFHYIYFTYISNRTLQLAFFVCYFFKNLRGRDVLSWDLVWSLRDFVSTARCNLVLYPFLYI